MRFRIVLAVAILVPLTGLILLFSTENNRRALMEMAASRLESEQEPEPEPIPLRDGISVNLDVLSLATVGGDRVSVADLKGNVVLLNVFGVFCGPCIYEVPHLIALHEEFGDKSLRIVAISRHDDAQLVASFVKYHEIPYTVLLDPDGKATDQFSPDADGVPLPTNIILDVNQKPVFLLVGHSERKFKVLRDTIVDLLK